LKKSSLIITCGRSVLEEIMSMWMSGMLELERFLHEKIETKLKAS
jgi:hypothetical protein